MSDFKALLDSFEEIVREDVKEDSDSSNSCVRVRYKRLLDFISDEQQKVEKLREEVEAIADERDRSRHNATITENARLILLGDVRSLERKVETLRESMRLDAETIDAKDRRIKALEESSMTTTMRLIDAGIMSFGWNHEAVDMLAAKLRDSVHYAEQLKKALASAACPVRGCVDGSIQNTGPDPQDDACPWCYARHDLISLTTYGREAVPSQLPQHQPRLHLPGCPRLVCGRPADAPCTCPVERPE